MVMPVLIERPSRGSTESDVRTGSNERRLTAIASDRTNTAAVCHQPRHIAQPGAPSKTSFSGPTLSGPLDSPVTGPSSASHGVSRYPVTDTGIIIVGTVS